MDTSALSPAPRGDHESLGFENCLETLARADFPLRAGRAADQPDNDSQKQVRLALALLQS